MEDYRMKLLLEEQLKYDKANAQKDDHLEDHQIARALQEEINKEPRTPTENCNGLVYTTKIQKSADNTKSLVDPSWELVDPTPNIHNLFIAFNQHFFWNKLLAVCVSWSKRMTMCAGICSYQGRGGLCSITLSEPLLKLRPRKDLVETLLHEMIHAYLFVTHNNRDRDGHGPEFHKHMHRINGEAGTNITVYHDFHDEVRLYQQHWWKCNGVCQNWRPYFGMVRRAINRAPGKYDRWWDEHSKKCGGTFVKVKEPEKKTKKKEEKENAKPKGKNAGGDIRTFFPAVETKNQNGVFKNSNANSNARHDNTKIDNIGGFKSGQGGSLDVKNSEPPAKNSVVIFNGVGKKLHANGTANSKDYSQLRDHWLEVFDIKRQDAPAAAAVSDDDELGPSSKRQKTGEIAVCPVCSFRLPMENLNAHLDVCLNNAEPSTSTSTSSSTSTMSAPTANAATASPPKYLECDICNEMIPVGVLEGHKEFCLQNASVALNASMHKECPICNEPLSEGLYDVHVASCAIKSADDIIKSMNDGMEESVNCLVCKKSIDKSQLDKHLNECMSEEIFLTDQEKAQMFDDSFDEKFDKSCGNGSVEEYPIIDTIVLDDDGVAGGNTVLVECPACHLKMEQRLINDHLDSCLN